MIYDAIVLSGGRSSRLGGHAKSQLVFDGSTLLRRSVDAVQDARQTIIVGDPGAADLDATTIVTRESPQFGGPAAAIAAGLTATTGAAAEWVLVLACDMPMVAEAVPVLLAHPVGDGVMARDGDGRDQHLLGIYRRTALLDAAARHDSLTGLSVRAFLSTLSLTAVDIPAGSSDDIDTWDDAARFDIHTIAGAHHG